LGNNECEDIDKNSRAYIFDQVTLYSQMIDDLHEGVDDITSLEDCHDMKEAKLKLSYYRRLSDKHPPLIPAG